LLDTCVHGLVGRAAIPSGDVGGHDVSTRLILVREADETKVPRDRGRRPWVVAGRERMCRRHPGLPVLGGHVQNPRAIHPDLVAGNAPDKRNPGPALTQLDTGSHGAPETGQMLDLVVPVG